MFYYAVLSVDSDSHLFLPSCQEIRIIYNVFIMIIFRWLDWVHLYNKILYFLLNFWISSEPDHDFHSEPCTTLDISVQVISQELMFPIIVCRTNQPTLHSLSIHTSDSKC